MDPQFFEEGARLGLDDATLRRLLGLAGAAPPKLRDPLPLQRTPAGTAPAPMASLAAAIVSAPSLPPVAAGDAAVDPPVSMLLQQNQLLMSIVQNKATPKAGFQDFLAVPGADLLDDTKV